MKKLKNTTKALVTLLFLLLPMTTFAVSLGVHGDTWDITEQDFRLRLAHDAAQVDWNKIDQGIIKRSKNFLDNQPQWQVTPASKDTIRLVDISQTIKRPIKRLVLGDDGKMHDQVLFPKGYQFNPLKYVHPHKWFVVFNGVSKDQVKWVQQLAKKRPGQFIFMAVDGTLSKLNKKTKLAIYPTNPWLFATAKVQHTPAVVGVSDSRPHRLTVAQFKIPYTVKRTLEAIK